MVNSRIVLDARFYGISHTGIGRYVENLIDHLPQSVTLIVSPENYQNPKLSRFPKLISRTHPYSLFSQIEIPILLIKARPKLVHIPYSSIPILWPGRMVVTFHDLIKRYSTGSDTTTRHSYLYWLKYFSYIAIDFIAAKRAAAIITPTHYWQQKLQAKYHCSRVYVTSEAVDDRFTAPPPQSVPGLKSPYLVHTGNLYPHKNISAVFQAIQGLYINLYLICTRTVFAARIQAQIQKMQLQHQIFFLGQLSDPQIASIYRSALALVFPSFIEGFGLNGLEAMACQTPVIASNSSCLPEVYGSAALYFDPLKPQQLRERILQLIKQPKLRQLYISRGLKQVKKYSWAKMGLQTWYIYQNALP